MFGRIKMEEGKSISSKWKTNQYLSFEMALKTGFSNKGDWGSLILKCLNSDIIVTERTT